MKSRAALLLLAVTLLVAAQAEPTDSPRTATTNSTIKTTKLADDEKILAENSIVPDNENENITKVAMISELLAKSPGFVQPFVNPKGILLQEIQSIDEDPSTSQIQEELARTLKAEAQKSRDKPSGTTTQKPRVGVTSTANAFFDDAKNPVTTKLNEDEALKALNQAETEMSYDEESIGDEDDDDDDDDEDDDDDDAYDDETEDEEEVMTECPNYCRCSGQYAAATTARCSKFTDQQDFGTGIAHLKIENAGEINLGPQAIYRRGLRQLESITIADTKIVNLDRYAFNGTVYVFSMNLTRNGLREIDPDYFANNSQLSLLTISGQPLARNWFNSRQYLLNASSIAELDFSSNGITRLPRLAFSKMPNLAFVDLKNNRLKNIEKSIFEGMDSLLELDLSNNLFNEIPEGIFLGTGLQNLRIISNNLTSLGIQQASKLTNLDASNNRIKVITKDDLVGVTALEKLIISSNGLKRIHQHSFSDLDQLTYLDISDNKLTSLNEHHLRSNPRLQVLIMSDNPALGKLPVFKCGYVYGYGTYSVYRLECANCGLDTLTEGTFDAMPALTKLNLARNRLARLPAGLLASLSSLRELDLSDNMINTLEPKMFAGARTLMKLNLAGNPLMTLQVTPFLQTPGLSRLDVSRCQLRRIWSEARQPLKSLRFLSVRGNELKRITLEELKATPKLSGLDASHNPFVCDEEFNQAIQWLVDHGVTPTEVLKYMSNYATAEDWSESEGVSQWSYLARLVCDSDDDGPPPRTIVHKPIDDHPSFTIGNEDNDLLSTGVEGLADLEFVHGQRMDGGLLDDAWRDPYQEYDVVTESSSMPIDWLKDHVWPLIVLFFIVVVFTFLFIVSLRTFSKSKGRGPVIRPPMMLRQGLVDNKNCGLVYKPLQEEIATPHMPKRGSFYSSSTFHYDKIVPESV